MSAKGKLSVHVISATGLEPKDKTLLTRKWDKSDPYFKVGLVDSAGGANSKPALLKDPKPHKSKVIKKNTSPTWVEPAWKCDLPVAGADAIMIEMFDWDLIGKDEELRRLVIPLKNIATDSKNFFEVVNEYEGSLSSLGTETKVEQLAPPTVNVGWGSVKVRITFEGADWASTKDSAADSLIKGVEQSGSKLDHGKLKQAAETFMKTADGKGGEYVIKSKAQLQQFLEQAGLLQMVLDFDAFSTDKLMVYSPDKMKTDSVYSKESLKKEDEWRSQQLDLLWAMCDIDGDGTVTFHELMMILAIQSNSDPIQRGELAFKLLDKDNSGSLSRSELLKLQQIYYKSFKVLFKIEFLNKVAEEGYKKGVYLNWETTQEITKRVQATLDNAKVPEALTDKIIALADKDDSGDVSKEEYINFLKDKDNEAAMTDFLATLLATVGLTAGLESAAVILKQASRRYY